MNGVIKLGVIAGGLWLLVKNTNIPAPTLPNMTPDPSTAPPLVTTPAPSSTTPATTTPASTPAPNQPTPATAPVPATDAEAIARLAAAGNTQAVEQAIALGLLYNSDQWNWFRAAGGGGYTTTDLFPPGNRDYKMNVREYLMRRNSAGLSGLRSGWRQRT